jgi:radical SAM protein with 4Fe4S-binding SPASM domain
MEALTYGEFSLALHRRAAGQRVPIVGAIEVTRRCPLRCVHCYNNLPLEDREAIRNELTYEEHCRIVDEISEAGCLWLLYTGGEIFLRKDFLDIYTYAKKKGLVVSLFTNGVLLTPEIADRLVEWRPFSIEITLYGRTEETYERITGIPGSFEKCIRGIRLLLERNLPLKLKTMALTSNKHEIWEMKRFAEEDLGVEFRFDAMINPRIDCAQSPLAFRLSPEEVMEFDLRDPKRLAEWGEFCTRFGGPVHPPDQMDRLYHCGGGVSSFAIDPYGKLSICVLSNGSYDLRRGPFREGWEGYLLHLREKKITRHTKCLSCEIKAMCGMCPANGELENRDPEEPVDFLCQVAHLRAKALGLPVKPHGECEYCKD